MKQKKPRYAAIVTEAQCKRVFVLLVLVGLVAPCTAAEWSVEPRVNTMYEYNDNRSLTVAAHDSTTGYVADLFLPFAFRTSVSEVSVTPRIRSQRYDDSRLDSDDYYLNLQSRLDATRTHWRLDAGRSWASTLTTEFQDVGLVDVQRQRNGLNLNPNVSHDLTERIGLRLGGSYESVSYDEAQGSALVDTNYLSVDVGLAYQLTEATSLNISGYHNELDAKQIGNQTRNTGGQLSLDHRFSEQSRLTLSYGTRRTESEITNSLYSVSDRSNGQIYNAGWTYRGESRNWNLNLGQSVLPSGFGFLVERKEARTSYEQSLNERTSLSLSILTFQHRGISNIATSTNDDRDYARASVGLRRRISPFWDLSATYVYVWQEFVNTTAPARSNALFLGVSYSGQRYSWSR